MFLVGIGWAIVRRYVQRPYRIRIKTKPEDAVILGTFLVIGAHRLLRRRRCASRSIGRPDVREVVVRRLPALRRSSTRGRPARCATRTGGCGACTSSRSSRSSRSCPTTKLRHMFTSPMNMYLKDRDRPKGAMKPMPNLMETELEIFGAVKIEDFTWKQLLRHRRVHGLRALHVGVPGARDRQAARPARDRAEGRRGDGRDRRSRRCRRRSASTRDITVGADSVFERITSEEIWACTSCKACDEICPVNIEILDKILDMRRYLTLMESDFPAELGNTYRSMENSGNAYGLNQGERGDWADAARRRRDRRARRAVRPRVPLLRRLRGQLRRPQQEDEPRARQAAAARRHRLRDPRPERDVQRRPGPPLRQRVHLPDARDAERRDVQRAWA